MVTGSLQMYESFYKFKMKWFYGDCTYQMLVTLYGFIQKTSSRGLQFWKWRIIEHSTLFISFLALRQNISSNQFQNDLEVERNASRWLMTQDTEHYQHGVGKLTCLGGGTTWKRTGLAVQLTI
jgi:hypothetical protein